MAVRQRGGVTFGMSSSVMPSLVVGVERERFVAREDRFRAREAEAGFVEADGAVQLRLPVRNRRVAHGVFRQRIAEVVHAAVRLAGIDAGLPVTAG